MSDANDLSTSWVPDANEVAAKRLRRSVQHHDLPTTGMGTELPNVVQKLVIDKLMAGPRAMGRVARGELDPTSEEGAGEGLGIAMQTLGQSPFVKGLGAGGGKMVQPSPSAARGVATSETPRYTPLQGLPDKPIDLGEAGVYTPGPHAPAHEAAESYMREAGLPYEPPRTYAPVDVPRAQRIAQEFDAMPHAPDDPRVRASYEALARETLAQWQAIKKTGLHVEPITGADPYAATPRLAVNDVVKNNHLYYFPTDQGFGTGEGNNLAGANHPMLQPSGEMIGGQNVPVNDIFRIVHDYFGHVKNGVGFRGTGEENAWRAHSAMYSPEARPAMTTETRGQNSWLNYGPHADFNKTASAKDTVYAPQKIGLLPDWAIEEGRGDTPSYTPSAPAVRSRSYGAQTVADPQRNAYPGIYGDPVEIAQRAEARVPDENPMLKRLFGVTRGDLHDIAMSREGNREPEWNGAANPKGSRAVSNIMTTPNEERLVNIMEASKQHAPRLRQGMVPWYVMDPAYHRLVELVGPEEAAKRYDAFNTFNALSSHGTDVISEMRRGTAANYLNNEGRFQDFVKHGGGMTKRPPRDMLTVPGHPYHTTATLPGMQKFVDTGKVDMTSAKVPLYRQAGSVPELGFQTKGAVMDSHWSRAVGLGDTRRDAMPGRNAKGAEVSAAMPWWRENVAEPAGLQAVPAQALTWGLHAPLTGVSTPVGAPKLELLAGEIERSAKAGRNLHPEDVRDRVLIGKDFLRAAVPAAAGAGGAAAAYAPRDADAAELPSERHNPRPGRVPGEGGGGIAPRPTTTHEGQASSWIPPQSDATPRGLPFEPTGGIVSKVPEQDTAGKQEGLQQVLQRIWRNTVRDHKLGQPYAGKQ